MSEPPAVVEEARRLFESEGLPLPFVPEEMAPALRRISEWVYGTRADDRGPYDLGAFVLEAATGPVPNYLLFGQAGHGIQSYAVHYYLVRGPLALFLQVAWGGAYTDREEAARQVRARFVAAEELARAVERGGLPEGERLFVIDSSFHGSRWARLPASSETPGQTGEWHEGEDPIAAALDSFTA